ncbi:glucuronate isomerase [Prevotella sp. S7-1-8]
MGDRHKWRYMRANGMEEKYRAGEDASDLEKFEKRAESVLCTFCNPVY